MAMAESTTTRPVDRPDRYAASWWGRVGASILDSIVIAIPLLLGVLASAAGVDALGSVLVVVYFAAILLYAPVLLATRAGRTIGKQAADIRVETMDGGTPGFWRAFGRELLKTIFGFTVILWIVDVLWPLWDDQRQTFADKIGRSVVVAEGNRAQA